MLVRSDVHSNRTVGICQPEKWKITDFFQEAGGSGFLGFSLPETGGAIQGKFRNSRRMPEYTAEAKERIVFCAKICYTTGERKFHRLGTGESEGRDLWN